MKALVPERVSATRERTAVFMVISGLRCKSTFGNTTSHTTHKQGGGVIPVFLNVPASKLLQTPKMKCSSIVLCLQPY